MITRQDYLKSPDSRTHHLYYSQVVTPGILEHVKNRIGLERILASTDPAFNDIRLSEWDGMSPTIIREAGPALELLGDVHAYSLGNAVCVAKCAARILKEEHEKRG